MLPFPSLLVKNRNRPVAKMQKNLLVKESANYCNCDCDDHTLSCSRRPSEASTGIANAILLGKLSFIKKAGIFLEI